MVASGRYGPSAGVNVTAGVAPSYGAWAELASSIPANVYGFNLIRTASPFTGPLAYNIGVGAAGSEVIIAADIFAAIAGTSDTTQCIVLPLKLPAGQRLAVQAIRPTAAGTATNHRVEWITNPWLLPVSGSRVVTYGFNNVDVQGTLIASGINSAFGTSVQMVSSTPRRARGISITGYLVDNGVTLNGLVQCVLGTSTNPVGPVFAARAATTTPFMADINTPKFYPCDIPSGSDLRLRVFNTGATASERYFTLHLLF